MTTRVNRTETSSLHGCLQSKKSFVYVLRKVFVNDLKYVSEISAYNCISRFIAKRCGNADCHTALLCLQR